MSDSDQGAEPNTDGIDLFGSFMTIGEWALGFALSGTPAGRVASAAARMGGAILGGGAAMAGAAGAAVESMNGGIGEAWGKAIGGFALGTLGGLLATTAIGALIAAGTIASLPAWGVAGIGLAAAWALGGIGTIVGGFIGSLFDGQDDAITGSGDNSGSSVASSALLGSMANGNPTSGDIGGNGGAGNTNSEAASNGGNGNSSGSNNGGSPTAGGVGGNYGVGSTNSGGGYSNTGNNPGNPNALGYNGSVGDKGKTGGGTHGKGSAGLTSPVLLDLGGDGLEIVSLAKSTMRGDSKGDGLLHRTACAGAGDGVLFIDADGNGVLSNSHEYVFTEWAGGASDDLDALRKVFDSNGDGKLTSADARRDGFKNCASENYHVGC